MCCGGCLSWFVRVRAWRQGQCRRDQTPAKALSPHCHYCAPYFFSMMPLRTWYVSVPMRIASAKLGALRVKDVCGNMNGGGKGFARQGKFSREQAALTLQCCLQRNPRPPQKNLKTPSPAKKSAPDRQDHKLLRRERVARVHAAVDLLLRFVRFSFLVPGGVLN